MTSQTSSPSPLAEDLLPWADPYIAQLFAEARELAEREQEEVWDTPPTCRTSPAWNGLEPAQMMQVAG